MSVPVTTDQQPDLIEVLANSHYPGASRPMIGLVIAYCRAAGLDPLMKPVHIVPIYDRRAGGMREVIMPGIGLYRIQAARTGQLAGISPPTFGPLRSETLGNVLVEFPEWCRVTVRRRLPSGAIAEFTAEEWWTENYATAGKDTKSPNQMWLRRPRGQLRKCAEAQALRMAFPELVGAAPTAEEMEGKPLETGDAAVQLPPPPPPPPAAHEPYPADRFEAQLPKWAELVRAGSKSPADIIATVSARYSLTDEQRAAIEALARGEGGEWEERGEERGEEQHR